MAYGHLSTSRDSILDPVVQSRGPEAYTETQLFMNRETTVIPPEEVPLLVFRGTSTDHPKVNLEERSAELQEVGDLNIGIIHHEEYFQNTDNKNQDNDNQEFPNRIDIHNSELERLISRLHNHSAAHETHKKQMNSLKTEIEKFIKNSEENQKLCQEDTYDFLNIILSDIKERLVLIEKCLNNPDFPKNNINCLYHLARTQLELYELPYSMFGLMVFTLKEENRSASLSPNAAEKTKKTMDRIVSALPTCEAVSDERIKQFIDRQERKVSGVMELTRAAEQSVPLTFGSWHRIYTLNQNAGFMKDSCRPSELFTQQFGLSSDDVHESIFPELDQLFKAYIPLGSQFTSLLISLDKGRGYSDSQSLYDLQAQRWSSTVLELALSDNLLEEGSTYIEGIRDQLQALQTMADRLADKITSDSSVFLNKLFTPRSTEVHHLTNTMIESIEEWLLDGLFHFFEEVFDSLDDDQEAVNHMKKIREEVNDWITQTRCDTEGANSLKELDATITRVSTSMQNIRDRIYVNSAHSLLDQMFETQFNQTARKFFLSQGIHSSDESSPLDQIALMFENFETRLENQRSNIFDKANLSSAFVGNCRVHTKNPVEPWHIKFVESVLSAKKHSSATESSEKEDPPKTDFLHRSLKSPSVLGKGMEKLGKFVVGKFTPKPYYEAHKFEPDYRNEENGWFCKVNLCDSDAEDYGSDDNGDITIDWKKKVGCSAKNYLQDYDANHAPSGELEENVGGLDHAIPTHDVLKNWYEVFKKSTAMYFPDQSEPKKQRQEALFELSSLAEKKSSVDLDHSDFLIKRFRSLWPDKSSQGQKGQLKSLEDMVSERVGYYRQSQFSQMAPQKKKEPVAQIEPMELSTEQKSFCVNLAPFFKTIIRGICSNDFRQDLTADLHSVQIITQITGFLNIPLAAEPQPQRMYKFLGFGDKTFQTLEEYTRRLTSEYFEHKKDLLAERFYEMLSKSSPLSRKKSSFLTALQNHHVHDFMADVEDDLKKNASSQTPQPLNGIKSVMESVQQSYEKVLGNLRKELTRVELETATPCIVGDEGCSELSPKEHRKKLQNKIHAGEALIENLKAIIEELQLGNESLTPVDRWTKVSEWIESHEASIMSTYGAAMLISIYYLAMGGTHPPHMYSTGGQLNFGSFEITASWLPEQLYTSADVSQVATTAGAIFTQFGQATGWKNDIRRMLDLLEGADAFSLVTSEIPTTLQSAMYNLHLSGFKPDTNEANFQSTYENGNYRPGSNCKDTVRDVRASLFTRKSPLQQSHPITDKLLRIGGSTATGAAQGASFWLLSSLFSAVCSPFCSWAPTIGESWKVMTGTCAAAGFVGGLTSETRLDYIARGLNFSTRVFESDRTMGGMSALIAQAIKTMRNRKDSTLIRLLVENPFKATLNVCGFSLPESFIKFFLHLFDGFISQIEIGDFSEWRKAHQKLLSSATAFNKAFEGKELTKYDLGMLKETLGEESVEKLGLECRIDPKSCSIEYKNKLAVVLNLLGYYVMIADLYYFLYSAIRHASKPVGSKDSIESGTTELSHTSPSPDSSEPTPTTVEDATFTLSGNSTSSTNEDTCPADTKKLPQAGKGWIECWLAMYEEFRKDAPLRRFFDVALFKTLPNLARYFDVQAHNAALGKKSNDPAMNTTLLAGIAKNSALGPLERLLQMSPSILSKCIGDVVNQLNTNIKEAMESVGQRNRDKATEALKKAAKDVYWRLLENANYDLSRAEKDMFKLIHYWQEDIGFQKLNAIATLREMIAKEKLKQCDADKRDFTEYKESFLEQLKKVMPSVGDKSLKVPEELLSQVQEFRALVGQFVNDMNDGKDMFRAVIPLLDALSSIDMKVVDAYVESELFRPLVDQPELLKTLPAKSCPRRMASTVAPPLVSVLHRRGQHLIVA